MTERPDWPPDDTPIIVRAEVRARVDPRNDQPVAILRLLDGANDVREVQVTRVAALQALRGLTEFLFLTEEGRPKR